MARIIAALFAGTLLVPAGAWAFEFNCTDGVDDDCDGYVDCDDCDCDTDAACSNKD